MLPVVRNNETRCPAEVLKMHADLAYEIKQINTTAGGETSPMRIVNAINGENENKKDVTFLFIYFYVSGFYGATFQSESFPCHTTLCGNGI